APRARVASHTSNRDLDLDPVVGNLADDLGMVAIVRNDHAEDEPGKTSSTWVLVARDEKDFGAVAKDIKKDSNEAGRWHYQRRDDTEEIWNFGLFKIPVKIGVWTDDYSNLLRVFNWKAK